MSRFVLLIFFNVSLARFNESSPARYGASPTITIDSGALVGRAKSDQKGELPINIYLGVPFAASPVRFEPPSKPRPWKKTFDASDYGPACMQQFPYQLSPSRDQVISWFNTPPPPAGESEDCLNVNVWSPAMPGKKAVMFWIYGGSLQFGANSVPNYDGSFIPANQSVVVVSVNYRTNVFGFPASPQLETEGQNLGWLDQHFALEWVQRNIHAFGGDPNRVTISGESAGAASVDSLVTSYEKDPPFVGAIMESGQSTFFAVNANASAPWDKMVSLLNCSAVSDVLACVRAIPATTIQTLIEKQDIVFRPQGNIAPVPILIGSNANEGRLFSVGFNSTQEYLQGILPNLNESYYDLVLAAYPIGSPGISNMFEQISAIDADYRFQCTAATVANDSLAAGFQTFRYFFNASFPNSQIFADSGVYHSSEINQIFRTYRRGGVTMKQEALSRYMQTAWATFAENPDKGPG